MARGIPPVCPKADPVAVIKVARATNTMVSCRMALRSLVGGHSLTVGPILLAMHETGVRRGIEGEMVQVGDVIGIDTVAQRRSVGETGDQDAGQSAESDIDDVVANAASAEGPTRVIASQGSEAALRCQRRGRDAEVDAGDIR